MVSDGGINLSNMNQRAAKSTSQKITNLNPKAQEFTSQKRTNLNSKAQEFTSNASAVPKQQMPYPMFQGGFVYPVSQQPYYLDTANLTYNSNQQMESSMFQGGFVSPVSQQNQVYYLPRLFPLGETASESNFLQASNSGRAEINEIDETIFSRTILDSNKFPPLDNKVPENKSRLNVNVGNKMKIKQNTKKEEVVIPDYILSEIGKLPEYLQSYVKGPGYMDRINKRSKYGKLNLYENKEINEKGVDTKTTDEGVNVYSYIQDGLKEKRPFVEPVVVNYVNSNMPDDIKMKLTSHCIARMIERLGLSSIAEIPEWVKNHLMQTEIVIYQDDNKAGKDDKNYLIEWPNCKIEEKTFGIAFDVIGYNAVAKTVLLDKIETSGSSHNFKQIDPNEYNFKNLKATIFK